MCSRILQSLSLMSIQHIECLHRSVAGYTDYSAAFYTYDVLLLISAVTVAVMPLGAKLPADNLLHDLVNIIKMPHIILFIFFLFALGNFWGFIESYLFLYLKELGAPNFLLGKHIKYTFYAYFRTLIASLNIDLVSETITKIISQ